MNLHVFMFITCGCLFKVTTCHPKYTDYRLEQQNVEPFLCKSPGLACDGCARLVYCAQGEDDDSNFSKKIIQVCSFKTYCMSTDDGDAACTDSPTENKCDDILNTPFPCANEGLFPDPFFCDMFQFCISNNTTGVQASCESNYAFNVLTEKCDVPLKNAKNCNYNQYTNFPIPICTYVGQTGILENPAVYYVCRVLQNRLYPQLKKCPDGFYFDTTSNSCSGGGPVLTGHYIVG